MAADNGAETEQRGDRDDECSSEEHVAVAILQVERVGRRLRLRGWRVRVRRSVARVVPRRRRRRCRRGVNVHQVALVVRVLDGAVDGALDGAVGGAPVLERLLVLLHETLALALV